MAAISSDAKSPAHSDLALEKKDIFEVEVAKAVGEGEVDYSGFAQKTDPAEIKLVRKLDRYIMPSLWAMYWLNYLDVNYLLVAEC